MATKKRVLWAVVVCGGDVCFSVPGGLSVYATKREAELERKRMHNEDAAFRGERRRVRVWAVRKYESITLGG